MNMNLDREAGTITQGDIAIGKAVARLAGGFQTQGEAQVMNLRLAPDMPVDFRMMADLQSERADTRRRERGGVAIGRCGLHDSRDDIKPKVCSGCRKYCR